MPKRLGQRTGLILIQGASGMGKTTLAKKIIQYGITERNALILSSRCSPFENVQLNAVDEIMDQLGCFLEYSGAKFLNKIAHRNTGSFVHFFPLFKHLFFRPRVLEHAKNPSMAEAIAFTAKLLNAISEVRPVFLFIDDYHWADDESVSFITELLQQLNPQKILLLLNMQNDEKAVCKLVSDKRPIHKTKKIASHTINLGPLDRIASRQAVEYFLGTGHENTNQIITESAGIPYFIDALSRFVQQRPPEKHRKKENLLSGFIDHGLSQLPDKARQILEFVAVAEKAIDFESALCALDMGKNKTALIWILIKRRFLRYVAMDVKPAFAIYHRLIGKSILTSLSPELKEIHRLVLLPTNKLDDSFHQ